MDRAASFRWTWALFSFCGRVTRTTPLMPSGACETSSTDGSRIDEKKLSRIASVSLSIAFAGTCA